jgi:hypothetical protein
VKRLIQDQKIIIDNHDRGSGRPTEFRGLHIDKTIYGGRYAGAQIRVPLDSDADLDIRIKNHMDKKRQRQLINEIRRALKDRQKREAFVEDVMKAIENYSSQNVAIENIRASAIRIARHFELSEDILEEIIAQVKDRILRYTSIHRDIDKRLYYITQSPRYISIGEFRGRKQISLELSNS